MFPPRFKASQPPPIQTANCNSATSPSPSTLPSISSRGRTLSSRISAVRFSFSLATLWSMNPALMVIAKNRMNMTANGTANTNGLSGSAPFWVAGATDCMVTDGVGSINSRASAGSPSRL